MAAAKLFLSVVFLIISCSRADEYNNQQQQQQQEIYTPQQQQKQQQYHQALRNNVVFPPPIIMPPPPPIPQAPSTKNVFFLNGEAIFSRSRVEHKYKKNKRHGISSVYHRILDQEHGGLTQEVVCINTSDNQVYCVGEN